MNSATSDGPVALGDWHFDGSTGILSRADEIQRLEPKVADLLQLLSARSGAMVPKNEIMEALWPDVVVSDDALPRCVSKLRKALGDDPKQPRFIETVPKRGYRLLIEPQAVTAPTGPTTESSVAVDSGAEASMSEPGIWRRSGPWLIGLSMLVLALFLWHRAGRQAPQGEVPQQEVPQKAAAERLVTQASDFYHQIDRADNESAIELYERALATEPGSAAAHAGLANALVQRVLRYPKSEDVPEIEPINLGNALDSGRFETTEARHHLQRALGLAERAVRLEPESAAAHKALGFVQSALGQLAAAEQTYVQALTLDPQAWDVLINLGDLQEIRGDQAAALRSFERAYLAMTERYDEQAARVRPWYAEMGVLIGDRYELLGRPQDAEIWYRKVLSYAPLHSTATCALARLLRRAGDAPAAERLEQELWQRTGEEDRCDELLSTLRAD